MNFSLVEFKPLRDIIISKKLIVLKIRQLLNFIEAIPIKLHRSILGKKKHAQSLQFLGFHQR